MEGPSSKRRKVEGNATEDAPRGPDPHPQDDQEPQPLTQPPPEPQLEAGTPQGIHHPESAQDPNNTDMRDPVSQEADGEPGKGTIPKIDPDTQALGALSQRVHDLDRYAVLLRTYVSSQACDKGKALLEALGLTRARIAKYYGMYPLNEEESVQDGLQEWIDRDINATWRDLLEAMKTAGIAVQQCDGLKKELYSNAGGADIVNVEEKARASATAGPDATGVGCPIVPRIKAEYVEVKGAFVKVCIKERNPTLDEVKDYCLDLIEGIFSDMPQISHYEDDIRKSKTLPELGRVVCFRLSSWISYDFFKSVIAHFQPTLKIVKKRLMRYEDQLKPLLQQKLKYIAELQQREDSYEVPENMAEFAVKYGLDADGLKVKDLIAQKNFLAQRLGLPSHLLQVLSWKPGSVVIIYRIVRDVLPLAELALYRKDTRAELTQNGVEDVYFASHPSEQPGLVDQPPQAVHLQRRAIVTVLDAHRQDLDATSLTSDLKGMGILTEEQCQKIASLDVERKHEALLYTLLAHDGPDNYNKLVECMQLRNTFIAADLQASFEDLKKTPGVLSVISSSQASFEDVKKTPGVLSVISSSQVEQIMDKFRERFITDVDANAIVFDLQHEGIISDGDLEVFTRTTSGTQRNKFLHFCLKRKGTNVALLKVCDIMIDNEGNPRMKQFGEDMKSALETGSQPQSSGQDSHSTDMQTLRQAQGTLSQGVEVCHGLPESLQNVRLRAYRGYQKLSPREGQHTLQFTKVAVLENAPKPRNNGDPDQGEFLKRYHDCGIRLSEGVEQVTVNHFLHKGPHQTRIIYGQPGTGKTTFLKHLCQKVASNEPSDFSLVLFFPLRDKAVSEALKKDSDHEAGLEQLLRYYIPGKKCSASAEALLESEGENVLIIFDGADEVRGLMGSPHGSLLGALLEGRLLPQAHFIVSTRPGGCPLLQEHNSLFYEILGFDEEAVESYVEEFFKNEPGKGEAMLCDLRARPDLVGGVYVPMNLLIFCSIYKHGVAGRSAFPATMTECYKSSTARSVTREKREKENQSYHIDPSLTDLPADVKHLLSSLGLLAFNGLTQEPPHYIFQEGEVRDAFYATVKLDETLDDSTFAGLLHMHPDQDDFSSTLNFSHTTKQEYFAAYHLSLLPEAEQAAFWRKNRHNPKFAIVLKFFSGLTKLASSVVSEAILPTGGGLPSKCDTGNPYLLYVFHALFESQNESLTQSIATQLNSCLTFELYLSPFDTMVLGHCLTKCKHLTELHISPRISYFSHHTSFHHVRSVVQSNPLLQSLTLYVHQFSTEDARAVCQAAGSLKKLKLSVNYSCTSEALAKIIDHRPLEELDFALYVTAELVGDSTVLKEKVARCNLKRLQLLGDSTVLLPLLNGVKDNLSIIELGVRERFPIAVSDQVVSAVVTCVRRMHQLKVLFISYINPLPVFQALGDRECLVDNVKVDAPKWWDFREEEWAQLEGAASCAKVLKVQVDVELSFGDNARGCTVLAAGLARNKVLQEGVLTDVPKEAEESVRQILQLNPNLTVVVN